MSCAPKVRKVVLVAPLPPPRGGIATWTEQVLQESKCHPDIQLELIDIAPRWRTVQQKAMWIRVVGGGLQLVRDAFQVIRLILGFRPDAIHLCTSAQVGLLRDILFLRIAGWFKVRSIYHLHFGRVSDLAQSRGIEWRYIAQAISLANTVVVLDKRSLETIQKYFPQKSVNKVPNCMNLSKNNISGPASQGSNEPRILPRITYVGWIIAAKGILDLIAATLQVANDLEFELEIIGPGDPAFVASIKKSGAQLGQSLKIKGELPHAETIMAIRETDILVLPSHSEGFPYVIVEAMALGKPVIGTDVGAIREILEGDGASCGIVIKARDVDSLAAAMRRLISDPQFRRILGHNGQEKFALRYSCAQVFYELKRIWFP